MIGLYIYLSGVLIIWCVYAYIVFIEKEEIKKKHILPSVVLSILSYLTIVFLIGFFIDDYMEEHGDEVVFNKKEEDDD